MGDSEWVVKRPLPQILLLAKPGLLKTEADLLKLIGEAGYHLKQVDRLPDSLPDGKTILIAHVRSTLRDPRVNDISGYKEFLHSYARMRSKDWIRLLVIPVPVSEGFDMVGYGTLVDCYVSEASEPAELVSFLNLITERFDEPANY